MKKTTLLIAFFALTCFAAAQNGVPAKSDRIYKADNSVIDCKIIEVGESEIKYKKANYLDGPTYTIQKNEVVTIQYANGDSEVINLKTNTVMANQNTQTSQTENSDQSVSTGSSNKFYEYVGKVTFKTGGVYIGAAYDFYWRLDDDSQNSNMYLGVGFQGDYGFGTTGTYGNTGINSNGNPIGISEGTLSSSVLYVPVQFRVFPSTSNFFLEAQVGPAFNFWRWSDAASSRYESDSGVKISVASGINLGYVSKGGFGITARWNSALGFGVGLNISYLERSK